MCSDWANVVLNSIHVTYSELHSNSDVQLLTRPHIYPDSMTSACPCPCVYGASSNSSRKLQHTLLSTNKNGIILQQSVELELYVVIVHVRGSNHSMLLVFSTFPTRKVIMICIYGSLVSYLRYYAVLRGLRPRDHLSRPGLI
jgi:hypothetical protein